MKCFFDRNFRRFVQSKPLLCDMLLKVGRYFISASSNPIGYINGLGEEKEGRRYFRQILPEDYNVKCDTDRMSEYFAKFGFRVPKYYSEAYAKWSGVESDRYMSKDLYYCYVIPALNDMRQSYALTDKNGFRNLFPGVLQPRTIARNRNGLWYSEECTVDEEFVIEALLSEREVIVKPSLGSECGHGVRLFRVDSRNDVMTIFADYKKDFIVQNRVSQHPVMSQLNVTSINTVRLYTYRDIHRKCHVMDECSIVRIGGKGAIIDNVSSGGGCCAVNPDGGISDRFLHEKTFAVLSLSECVGVGNIVIPNYNDIKSFAVSCHSCLPYFDLVGWDIVVTESGKPLLLEFNTTPFCEGPQMAHGPMFGRFVDEIMQRLCGVKRSVEIFNCRAFPNGHVLVGVY